MRRPLLLLIQVTAALIAVAPSGATDCWPRQTQTATTEAGHFNIYTSSGSTFQQSVYSGVAPWTSTCTDGEIPQVQFGSGPQSGAINVSVDYVSHASFSSCGSNMDACGCTSIGLDWDDYTVTDVQIEVFGTRRDGFPCSISHSRIIEHEMGHAFGLTHTSDQACANSLMYYGHDQNNTGTVTEEGCQAADEKWVTPSEATGGSKDTDPDGGGGVDFCGDSGCYTPLVIDIDGNGFRFTSAKNGVEFDMDGDSVTERIAWTQSGSEEAFLVLDRNGNGTIDDGRELFGDVTEQPTSRTPNGFAALGVLDEDGDGRVTPNDPLFHRLRLWFDRNGDGFSSPEELLPLERAHVLAVDLRYRLSWRRDRHGNVLRYWSHVQLAPSTSPTDHRQVQIVDVFLVSHP